MSSGAVRAFGTLVPEQVDRYWSRIQRSRPPVTRFKKL